MPLYAFKKGAVTLVILVKRLAFIVVTKANTNATS